MSITWRGNTNEQQISIGSIFAYKRLLILPRSKYNNDKLHSGIGPIRPVWRPNRILEARCYKEEALPHKAPLEYKVPSVYCSCGFYSMKKPKAWGHLDHYYYANNSYMSMLVIIQISGQTIEGTLGYRSQKAIVKAVIPDVEPLGQYPPYGGVHCSRRRWNGLISKNRRLSESISRNYEIPVIEYREDDTPAEELMNVARTTS